MASTRTLSAPGVLMFAFLAQIGGHLLLTEYMPNAAVGAVGFLFLVIIFSYILFTRNDPFGFMVVIYVCSHFSYADNQGGLWNLMAFGLLSLYLVLGRQKREFRQHDYPVALLLGVFVLANVGGWILNNPMPPVLLFQGIAAFFGFLLMYRLASSMELTRERVRLLLIVTLFMLLYQVVVAINQRYLLVTWTTPLLGRYGANLLDYGNTNAKGTLQNSELLGEYAVLLSCLLIPLLSSSVTQRELRFSSNWIVVMIFSSILIILLTSTRAALLLLIFVMVFYYLIFSLRIYAVVDKVGRQLKILLVLAALVPVIGIYVGLGSMEDDFADLAKIDFSVESVASGKAINRGPLTELALNRLDSQSWLVGNGFGVPRSNLWAWMGVDPLRMKNSIAGFHNLYLSLPMLYGWPGSLAFILLIIVTAFRLFRTSLKYRRSKSFLVILALGFSLFWGVFLADEFKISILRNPNYHMMFWIWLGLSGAVFKSIRFSRKAAPVPDVRSDIKEVSLS